MNGHYSQASLCLWGKKRTPYLKVSVITRTSSVTQQPSSGHVELPHRPWAADDVERLVDAVLQYRDLPLLDKYVFVQGFDLLLQRHNLVLHDADVSSQLLCFLPRQVPLLRYCFQCSTESSQLLCRFLEILLDLID